jgi:hypothetical protein
VRRRRQIGVAHAEIDDVGAAIAGRGLGAVHLLENVRRQPADAIEIFHRRLGDFLDSYHGFVSAPVACPPLGAAGRAADGAVDEGFFRASAMAFLPAGGFAGLLACVAVLR